MKDKNNNCPGRDENDTCAHSDFSGQSDSATTSRKAVLEALKEFLTAKEVAPSKEDLARAADMLNTVAPYNYDAWRLHTDLLLNALRQLEKRQLQPDVSFTLLAIPLRENDLRDAAEAALRQCAHFADSAETRIALVDEANRVRRVTWF